ncbi:MAG TPA: polysaccharide deacetylase family protein [Flavobacterium sp.]|uniref:polysaccharide deacetylase family protein n=1 Tax=Flavobacterium sp. TaxID=239 RepID=UPI002D0CC40B|nr:polysaccharide deacetylase family protein [Flavobacterium sp.]HSD15145.1 polysaccharide deacetylase family protein [Flavobacterium sp.]
MLKHKNILLLFVSAFAVFSVLSFYIDLKWWSFLPFFVFWVGLTIFGSSNIKADYFVKSYCSNPAENNLKIAISFDDGPHPMTEKVLDLLKKYNAKATFFCIGSQIEKHPDIFKRIVSEGHTVGNHSYSHSNRFGFFSTQKVVEELIQTNAIIERFSGKKALYFRPPFGVTNPNIARAVAKTNHYVIGWNNRSLDTVIDDETKILERIKNRLAPGGIILLHDTSLKTVNVLEQLLLFLQSEKYECVTIDALLNLPAYEN